MNSFTRPMAAALAALALAASAVPNASLRKTETNAKPEGTVVDSISDDIRRPVPTEFETGNSYDDLLYFEDDNVKNEEIFSNLPQGKSIADDSDMISAAEKFEATSNMSAEVISVSDMEFDRAVKISFLEIEERSSADFTFSSHTEDAEEGDNLLVRMWIRSENQDIWLQKTAFQMCVTLKDVEGKNIRTAIGKAANDLIWGSEWIEYYLPVEYKEDCADFSVQFKLIGRKGESIEIGGFEIINYKKDVAKELLPNGTGSLTSLRKNSTWRVEAWERIEQIRKGDMNITVVDKNGKSVKNATVDVNMYEHDFEFGSAINANIIAEDEEGEKYRKVVETNFNAAVLENHTKWPTFDSNPETAKKMYEKLQELGINKLRSHVLYWDEEMHVPAYAFEHVDDLETYQSIVKEHFKEVIGKVNQFTNEFDVVNEAVETKYMQDKYGKELLREWYGMAREILGEDGILYYNDYYENELMFGILDYMTEIGVDFDGIGIQSHIGKDNLRNADQSYKFYDLLAQKYGKRLKITEYTLEVENQAYQANYTRDRMISAFSTESMEGFLMWWFKDWADGPNADMWGKHDTQLFYDIDWNEKLSLKVWQDMIYNKWWTRESLTTDETGKVSLRGFYGDYDVTVTTADGKTKTVSIPLHKGEESNFIIVID